VKYLLDVNVLFPLLLSRHSHRERAVEWFGSTNADEAGLCRVTRLGALRLLCTHQVMGPDVLLPKAALKALEAFEADERITLPPEPQGIDAVLQKLVAKCATTPNLWTDAYLAAFAQSTELQLVTFDWGFSKFSGLNFHLLAP